MPLTQVTPDVLHNIQSNVTQVGTLSNLTVSGNITAAAGNIGNLKVIQDIYGGAVGFNINPLYRLDVFGPGTAGTIMRIGSSYYQSNYMAKADLTEATYTAGVDSNFGQEAYSGSEFSSFSNAYPYSLRTYGVNRVTIAGNGANVTVNITTPSTSTTTGALIIRGGVGVAGNINTGNIIATNFTYANGVSILSDLYANAASQAGSIATLTSNAAAQAGDIGTIYANLGAVSGSLATLTANAGAQAGSIATLTSNAATQAGQIASAEGNIVTANTAMKGYVDGQISTVNSNWQANAGAQAGDIATLFANAASQAGSIATLTSNAAVQAGDIATLFANAGAQAGSIATLTSNAAVQAGLIADLTSNAAVQAGDIATLFANAGAQSGSIATLTSNAAVQAGLIAGKADLSGASFTGNVTTSANVKFTGWQIYEAGTKLFFAYNGAVRMSLATDGNLTVTGDVAGFGTP